MTRTARTSARSAPHPLELIDEARSRQEAALPELDARHSEFVAHLAVVGQLAEIYFHRILKPLRISYSESRVLSALRIQPRGFRATPHALNDFAQITSAGMTRTLDRLEGAGYVDRVPNPEDRRSVLVGLTDAGWAFSEKLLGELNAAHADLLAGVAPEQRAAEIEVLRSIIERLSATLSVADRDSGA